MVIRDAVHMENGVGAESSGDQEARTGEAMRQRLGTCTVILGKGGSVWP
jgi:hypothetical protein